MCGGTRRKFRAEYYKRFNWLEYDVISDFSDVDLLMIDKMIRIILKRLDVLIGKIL